MRAQPNARGVQTFTYKHAGDLALAADVDRAPMAGPVPIVVWIHGGALINGDRTDAPAWLRDACRRNRWTLVSIDYRLAPETKLPDIVRDVEDAIAWVRADGPRLFGADPGRIALVGESAGGYLTLTMGSRVRPRVQALVSLYGYGNLIGDWYTRPSAHPCHHERQMTSDAAAQLASGPPVADSSARMGDGYAFYQRCRQLGHWPREVSGWDPQRDASRFEPYMPIARVTTTYPPTALIHGDIDSDVPFDESVEMARRLGERGVEHAFTRIPGGEHGFAGAKPEVVTAALDDAVTFLRRQLQARRTGHLDHEEE